VRSQRGLLTRCLKMIQIKNFLLSRRRSQNLLISKKMLPQHQEVARHLLQPRRSHNCQKIAAKRQFLAYHPKRKRKVPRHQRNQLHLKNKLSHRRQKYLRPKRKVLFQQHKNNLLQSLNQHQLKKSQ